MGDINNNPVLSQMLGKFTGAGDELAQKLAFAKQLGCCVPINGCGSAVAIPYFVSFTLIVTFIKLNLFIAVILDGFGESQDEEDALLKKEDFTYFADAWLEFDPTAKLFMKSADLPGLIKKLPVPMGFEPKVNQSEKLLLEKIEKMHIPVKHKQKEQDNGSSRTMPIVYFQDVHLAVVKRAYKEETPEDFTYTELPHHHRLHGQWNKKFPFTHKTHEYYDYDVRAFYAAESLQKHWLAYKARKKLLK